VHLVALQGWPDGVQQPLHLCYRVPGASVDDCSHVGRDSPSNAHLLMYLLVSWFLICSTLLLGCKWHRAAVRHAHTQVVSKGRCLSGLQALKGCLQVASYSRHARAHAHNTDTEQPADAGHGWDRLCGYGFVIRSFDFMATSSTTISNAQESTNEYAGYEVLDHLLLER